MGWQWTPYVIAEVTAGVVLAILALCIARRSRVKPVPEQLVLLLVVAAIWILAHAVEIGSASFVVKDFSKRMQIPCAVTMATTWLFLILQYTNRGLWLRRRTLVILSIVPTVVLVLALTNNAHGLMWSSIVQNTHNPFLPLQATKGVAAWGAIAYAYILLTLGCVFLAQTMISVRHVYHQQFKVIMLVLTLVLVAGFFDVFDLEQSLHGWIARTPWVFALGSLIVMWTFTSFQPRDILPVAREAMVDSMTDSVIVLDIQDRILDLNRAAERLAGHTISEVFGRRVEQIWTDWPSGVEACEDRNKAQQLVFRRGDEERIYDMRGSPVADLSGRLVGKAFVLRDVTERKRAEVELQADKELIERILATMPNAVLVLGKDSQVILANRAFYAGFNTERDEVDDKSIDEVIPVADLSERVPQVLAGTESELCFEFRHRVAGHDRILVASIISMRKGEALLILRDVTDERERQERLYLTDRLASVGEMASGIAHELNNPLTSVISLSQLLTDADMPDDAKEDVEAIYSEAQRAAGVVKNLLTFARKHMPVRQLTQINKVVEDMLTLRAYEHRVNNVQVNTEFAPELPEIMVDYFQMQQVFLNIILNAESAMIEAHNQGTLTITTERVNDNINVSFADDGPGIAPENLSRLFDPFFTTKEIGKGTGLGLSICYGIVTGHGGRIYAQSELGGGATFVVELPMNAH